VIRSCGASRSRPCATSAIAGARLFQSALARNPEGAARRELLVEVSQSTSDDSPSAASAVAVLADADASAPLKDKARTQLRAALASEAATAAPALVTLVAQDRAPADARIFAIELLRDLEPIPKLANLVDSAHAAFNSKSPAVRAAALPLYAKVDPDACGWRSRHHAR